MTHMCISATVRAARGDAGELAYLERQGVGPNVAAFVVQLVTRSSHAPGIGGWFMARQSLSPVVAMAARARSMRAERVNYGGEGLVSTINCRLVTCARSTFGASYAVVEMLQ